MQKTQASEGDSISNKLASCFSLFTTGIGIIFSDGGGDSFRCARAPVCWFFCHKNMQHDDAEARIELDLARAGRNELLIPSLRRSRGSLETLALQVNSVEGAESFASPRRLQLADGEAAEQLNGRRMRRQQLAELVH